jgi:4-amino-4-deoxychorismate lyase
MVNHPVKHLVDGVPADTVPVSNRGLAYGDGLFETVLFRGHTPVLWELHYERLVLGCKKLALDLPANQEQQLLAHCGQLLEENNPLSSIIKIMVIRNSNGRGYRPSPTAGVQTIISLYPAPDYPERWYTEGVNLWACQTRLSVNSQFAGIKHLARLEQVMASMEFSESEYQEGLMFDTDLKVIECTRSNIFFEIGDHLITPALDHAGVEGTMRAAILDCEKQLGIRISVQPVNLGDLVKAHGGFVCNSAYGIWPVRAVHLAEDKMLSWQQGSMTKMLQNHFYQTLELGVCLE